MSITKQSFGFADGKEVFLYTLTNKQNASVSIITYGGAVTGLTVPDKNGNMRDVVLGYDNISAYQCGSSYQGALIGRYANRIAKGEFTLNGTKYSICKNDNVLNSLHGGKDGYNAKVWNVLYTSDYDDVSLSLTHVDKDGTENYPGTVNVNVVYTLTKNNELVIEYNATTDKDTIINLTNHTYFNLNGYDSGDVLTHIVKINADHFTPVDNELISTGEIRAVKGTALDFNEPKPIGRDIESQEEQMLIGGGFDHNFVTGEAGVMKHIAEVVADESGIIMNVYSEMPAVQLYTGNFLSGDKGKNGSVLNKRNGFCLETQYYPDSPNHENFPSSVLKPGEKYHFTTKYAFSHK